MLALDVARLIDLPRLVPHEGLEGPWWQAWSVDPEFLIPVGLLVAFYFRGLGRWPERSRAHPWWKTALFTLGVVILVMSAASPVHRLSEHHFTMHMVQHEMVMMLAVPLILLGAPTTPVLRGLPRWARRGVVRPLARRHWMRSLYRFLTHPIVAVAAFSLVLWSWHLIPGWYDRALEDELVHDLQHLSFAFAAALLWWNVIDPAPLRSRVPHLPRVLYVFAAGIPKHFLGAMITFADTAFYATYLRAEPVLPLTPIEDQQLGALIMWVPSSLIMLIAMAIMFFVWMHVSERDQRRAEARAGRPAAVEA